MNTYRPSILTVISVGLRRHLEVLGYLRVHGVVHLLVYLRFVLHVLTVKNDARRDRKANERDHEVHLCGGALVHRLLFLFFALLVLDAVEGGHGALHCALLAVLVDVLLLYHCLLVCEAGRFAFFRTVVELGANVLEEFVGISVITLKLLAIHRNARMHVHTHLGRNFVVAIQE